MLHEYKVNGSVFHPFYIDRVSTTRTNCADPVPTISPGLTRLISESMAHLQQISVLLD